MFREVSGYSRLIVALWRGDLRRSITGSRAGSIGLEASMVIAAAGWLVVAWSSSVPGSSVVPVDLQRQLVDDVASGCAVVGACIACVLVVLVPPSRQIDTMLAGVPMSRAARTIGPLVPAMIIGMCGGPIALAPLVAAAMRTTSPGTAALVCVLAVSASSAAVLLTTAMTQALRALFARLGLPDTLGQTAAVSGALAAAVSGVLALRAAVAAAQPTVSQIWSVFLTTSLATTLALVALALALALLLRTSRLQGASMLRNSVNLLPRAGRRLTRAHVVGADVLLWMRDPSAAATSMLLMVFCGAAFIARLAAVSWAPLIGLALTVATPCVLAMTLYGTDRTTAWRRNAVGVRRFDCWPVTRTIEGGILGGSAAVVAAFFLLPALGAGPTSVLALLMLSVASGLLAGVLVPSDLELPAAPVLAAGCSGLLLGLPVMVLPRVASIAVADGLQIAIAFVYCCCTPAVIALRRHRSILA